MPCAETVVVFCAGGHKCANAVVVICSNSKPIGGGGGGGGQQQGRGKPQMRLASELAGRRRWFCWLSWLAGWLTRTQTSQSHVLISNPRGGADDGRRGGRPTPFYQFAARASLVCNISRRVASCVYCPSSWRPGLLACRISKLAAASWCSTVTYIESLCQPLNTQDRGSGPWG